jgi:hypothetical protein
VSEKHRDLDIDEDLTFQNREWVAQRFGMGILFLFVLGAALGLTGMGGPLSTGRAGRTSDRVFVEYDRFVRSGAVSTILVHLRAEHGAVRFWVSAPYFESVRVYRIAPALQLVSVDNDRHVYTVESGSSQVTIALEVEYLRTGRLDAAVGLLDGPSVEFTQWVWF